MLLVAQDHAVQSATVNDYTVPVAEELKAARLEYALHAAAREFLSRSGKAFRARLVETCFDLVARSDASVPRAACEAIELLHSGTLIVDDIQDGAEVRRGAPALHRAIGVPQAINTGNWLYFVALARLDTLPLTDEAARELTRAAHRCLVRCHEGQSLDLALRVTELRPADLAAIVRDVSARKTGTLMAFAASLGATLANASARELELLTRFGRRAGMALQMLDDLGSFVCESRHAKALEDLRSRRVSWVWAWANERLDAVAFQRLLDQLGRDDELTSLRASIAETVESLGRARVHEELTDAQRELRAVFAPDPVLDAIHVELGRLEKSYG
jgi:geranylgeranyl diphosphate synthase type I